MKILSLIFITANLVFANINLEVQETSLYDTTETTAKIKIANLQIGQSGIVTRTIDNNSIILAQAIVTQRHSNYSEIEFISKEILPQDAIATTLLRPENDDTFILNHLYNTSLLLVPNNKAKSIIHQLYSTQNFLNEDFFAAHLKVEQSPLPSKKEIINFAQSKQIGTIFIVIKNTLYILDSTSFKIIDTITIANDDLSTNSPFFTKITDIKRGLLDFGSSKIEDYDAYYSDLLGIN